MTKVLGSVMEREFKQAPKKVFALVTKSGRQFVFGKDFPDLSDRPEDLQIYKDLFGASLKEIEGTS